MGIIIAARLPKRTIKQTASFAMPCALCPAEAYPWATIARDASHRLVHLPALSESGWVYDDALPGKIQIVVNVALRLAFYFHGECPQRVRYFDPGALGT